MDQKVNYAVVGIFVLVFGAALIYGVLWLSSKGARGDYDRYLVYTPESVSGLSVDAAVRYRGVKVGRVAEIDLKPGDPTQVRLVLEIERGVPVKTDTMATLEMQGLTGLMNVNLTGGSANAPRLVAPARDALPVIPSTPSFMAHVNEEATRLARQLAETADRVNRLLSEENRSALSDTLANLQQITAILARESKTLGDALEDMRHTAKQARVAGNELPSMVTQFRESAAALERMAEEMAGAGSALRGQVEASGGEVRRFMGETLPEATAVVEELRETAASLRSASEALERDPSVLLYGATPPAPGPGE